jgi:hypothetical protein
MYYITLLITFIGTLFWSYYFWKMTKKKKRERFSITKLIVRYMIPGFLLFAFGVTFISHALDVKAVITKQASRYSGDCEILLESAEKPEDAWLEADFEDNWASFEWSDYPSIESGSYYCEVEYYPHSSEGVALKLYQSKGGEAVKIN